MESKYLKESLDKLAGLKARADQIQSDENRDAIRKQYDGRIEDIYPHMCGQIAALVSMAHWDIESAQRSAERLEVIEREHARFVGIMEGLGVDLDEAALSALESLGTDAEYQSERRALAYAINKVIADVQESEREIEHDRAIEAITAAGFALSDPDEYEIWSRGEDRITCEMNFKNQTTTYSWELERNGVTVDSGKSGEFSRLIALLAPVAYDAACGVSPSGEPCDAGAKA